MDVSRPLKWLVYLNTLGMIGDHLELNEHRSLYNYYRNKIVKYHVPISYTSNKKLFVFCFVYQSLHIIKKLMILMSSVRILVV